jgi:serine-type D-Ala-D-Ala carboxypeptidase
LSGRFCYKHEEHHFTFVQTLNAPFDGQSCPTDLEQDQVFRGAFALLEAGIAGRAFPGACVAVVHKRRIIVLKAFGHFTYEVDSPAVATDTIWDLASVTKVVATTAMGMALYERGQVKLEQPLAEVVPEFTRGMADERRGRVTLQMLLAHSSGLPAYHRIYEKARTPEEVMAACCASPLESEPGSRAEYSDIGFILLGAALERIAGEKLDAFCRREIFAPIGMTETQFNPPLSLRERTSPTEDDRRFRHRVVQGEVNDENAYVLGGVAGHAGMFSTAVDMARFGCVMLNGGGPILRRETVALFTTRQGMPSGTSRALGWDTPSQPSQSGTYFSARSFGHLGFTGTSLWCDPQRELCIVLLTNRTWPDRSSQMIKQVRPAFHDAVVKSVGLA